MTSSDKKQPASETPPTGDNRLAWELALHEERILNQRSNLFLVSESMMLAAYISGWGRLPDPALMAVAVMGILISVIWLMINGRQHRDMAVAGRIAYSLLDEFKTVQNTMNSGRYNGKAIEKFTRIRNLNRRWALYIFLYGLPILLGSLWLFLLTPGSGIKGRAIDFLSYPPIS